ncbi:MAG: hypothetical protein V7K92_00600 [Nostoc sp.]
MAGKILALDTADGGMTYIVFDVSVLVGNWRYSVGDRSRVKSAF